jgi:hypothetical protein
MAILPKANFYLLRPRSGGPQSGDLQMLTGAKRRYFYY